MTKVEKIILRTFAGLMTALLAYVILRLWTSNAAFSIVPGWHTTIYPPEITWAILTAILLATSILVYFVFRGAIKLLTALWTKIKS